MAPRTSLQAMHLLMALVLSSSALGQYQGATTMMTITMPFQGTTITATVPIDWTSVLPLSFQPTAPTSDTTPFSTSVSDTYLSELSSLTQALPATESASFCVSDDAVIVPCSASATLPADVSTASIVGEMSTNSPPPVTPCSKMSTGTMDRPIGASTPSVMLSGTGGSVVIPAPFEVVSALLLGVAESTTSSAMTGPPLTLSTLLIALGPKG